MRFLMISAHPIGHSLSAALRKTAAEALRAAGHEVDEFDLYAAGFDPVLSAEERGSYFQVGRNLPRIGEHVARLKEAEGIVLIYPTWWFGFPAILKGYFDRIWVPGVAFDVARGSLTPRLTNIVRFAVVTTYGSPWWYIRLVMGDPMGKIVRRGLAKLCHPSCKTLFLAQYSLDSAREGECRAFLERVRRRLATF